MIRRFLFGLALGIAVGTLVFLFVSHAFGTEPGPASNDDINLSLKKLDAFAAKHSLTYSLERAGEGSPLTAKLMTFKMVPEPGNPTITDAVIDHLWEEDNYPTAAQAVQTVERDYVQYPKGYHGVFKGK